jgi:SAM-dependent methyltransferase
MSDVDVKEAGKEKYGRAALRVRSGGGSCCAASSARGGINPITSNHYDDAEKGVLPEEALLASLSCGNPTALAQLEPGATVLDLGSGGGIDVLLSARRVGPSGKAYGLDMTDEMLALARENQRKAGVENVEFLKGEIENIPLPDNSVDVVISNCVINLSVDKDRVLSEASSEPHRPRVMRGDPRGLARGKNAPLKGQIQKRKDPIPPSHFSACNARLVHTEVPTSEVPDCQPGSDWCRKVQHHRRRNDNTGLLVAQSKSG